jgi:hypothetical protein
MNDLKTQLQSWRERYVSAVNEAKRANLEAGQVKKEALDSIFGKVEAEGGKPLLKAFKAAMTTLDHADKARGKREDVVDAEEATVLNAFDHLMILFDEQLSLFDDDVKIDMEANAGQWPPESNVTDIKSAA